MGSNRIVKARARSTGATKPLEKEVQVAGFQFMRTLYVSDLRQPLSDFAFAVPNGTMLAGTAKQRAQYMQSLKAQGFKPGVSDIFIALPRGSYHGAFIEVKRGPKETPSDAQATWLRTAGGAGYLAQVAFGLDELLAILRFYAALPPYGK